jgi:glycolate oxidase
MFSALLHRPGSPLLQDRSDLVDRLAQALPRGAVIGTGHNLSTYERDGSRDVSGDPLAVVLPEATGQVETVMRLASQAGVSVMPRGAGTSRCGGAIPLADSLVVGTSRMRQVLAFDADRGLIRVQAGVTNLAVSTHSLPSGWRYAPDPSSRRTCSIGGNVGSNASGACALRHGRTSDKLRGLTAVRQDGSRLDLGGHCQEPTALDLMGLLCGSEGQLVFVTEVTLALDPMPESAVTLAAHFRNTTAALAFAERVLCSGWTPYRIEYMDAHAIGLTERVAPCGYDTSAQALVLVELQGFDEEVRAGLEQLRGLLPGQADQVGKVRSEASDESPLWHGRESIYRAASASGAFEVLDVNVPLGRLIPTLQRVGELAATRAVPHATVAHLGDGTLHTFLTYDPSDGAARSRVRDCADDIRLACVAEGGSISAEYGVGLSRRHLLEAQYAAADLDQQRRVRHAFVSNDRLNPGKVLSSQVDFVGHVPA